MDGQADTDGIVAINNKSNIDSTTDVHSISGTACILIYLDSLNLQ